MSGVPANKLILYRLSDAGGVMRVWRIAEKKVLKNVVDSPLLQAPHFFLSRQLESRWNDFMTDIYGDKDEYENSMARQKSVAKQFSNGLRQMSMRSTPSMRKSHQFFEDEETFLRSAALVVFFLLLFGVVILLQVDDSADQSAEGIAIAVLGVGLALGLSFYCLGNYNAHHRYKTEMQKRFEYVQQRNQAAFLEKGVQIFMRSLPCDSCMTKVLQKPCYWLELSSDEQVAHDSAEVAHDSAEVTHNQVELAA